MFTRLSSIVSLKKNGLVNRQHVGINLRLVIFGLLLIPANGMNLSIVVRENMVGGCTELREQA